MFDHRWKPGALRGWLGGVAAVMLTASVASAEGAAVSRYGGRLGLSLDPDQITLGAFVGFPEFTDGVSFRPSVDLGLGDDLVTIIGNADVQYAFTGTNSKFHPYFGGGLGVLWFDHDAGGSDSEIGLNVYGGIEMAMRGYKTGMLELRIGVDDMPDLKITYAIGFY